VTGKVAAGVVREAPLCAVCKVGVGRKTLPRRTVVVGHVTVEVPPTWTADMVAARVAEAGIQELATMAKASDETRETFMARIAEAATYWWGEAEKAQVTP
jgi:hypothetical protein